MNYPLFEAKNEIKKLLSNTLSDLNCPCEIKLETPPDDSLGDFAFPCFQIAPIAKKSPNEIAQNLVKNIKKTEWFKKIESKGPYVNFYLNEDKIVSDTLKLIKYKKQKYGYLDDKKTRVIVEHTSANPNGPLHVGRARNPIIGDTIVRILKAAGYKVESQFYLDDLGKQVATLAWGVNNLSQGDVPKSEYDKPDHKTVGYYQKASDLVKNDETVAVALGEIVKKLEEGDNKTIDLVHKAYTPVLKGIKESMKQINIKIDTYVPESDFVKDKSVDRVVEKLKKSEYSGEEDGAYYIDMEPFGIKGRNTKFFFTRSDGTTLYATRDIAYHIWKAKKSNMLVNILGEDHKLESKQVEITLKLLGEKQLPHVIFYSFVSLPGGKMSTRRGRVVYLDDLIEECMRRAYDEVKKRRGKELSENKLQQISEIIGKGALRYNIIKVQPEKDIVFKWEDALNFEGNAAPFIQYAHARACSILSKNKEKIKGIKTEQIRHISEIKLIKKLSQLPITIDEAAKGYKPHILTTYLFDVASEFNQFYRDCPVLSETNNELKNARLAIVDATRIVLSNTLDLLGIQAPEEM